MVRHFSEQNRYFIINDRSDYAFLLSVGYSRLDKDPWGRYNDAIRKYGEGSVAFLLDDFNKFGSYGPETFWKDIGVTEATREEAQEIIKKSRGK